MLTKGFIKLNRSVTESRWYKSSTFRLFLHLLLTANYEALEWREFLIARGQRVVTLRELSEETGMSKSAVERGLWELEKSGDIKREPCKRTSLITVTEYDSYVDFGTNEGQKWDDSGTEMGQKWDKWKKNNKNNNINNNNNRTREKNSDFSKISFSLAELEASAYERYKSRKDEK